MTISVRTIASDLWHDSLYSNARHLVINTGVISLAGFVFWIIVARFYNVQAVGYSSAIISVSGFLSAISMVGFDLSIIYFLPKVGNKNVLLSSCIWIISSISILVGAFFVVTVSMWSPTLIFIRGNIVFTIVFIGLVFINTIAAFLGATFIAGRATFFVLLKSIIFSASKIILPIVFASIFLSFGIVASIFLAYFISCFMAVIWFLPRIIDKFKLVFMIDKAVIKSIWKYSIGNYIVSLVYAIPSTFFVLIVVNILGPEKNAYFYIVWGISTALASLSNCISYPLLAEMVNTTDTSRIMRKTIKLGLLMIVPVVLILIFSKLILSMFGSNYANAENVRLLWILSIASLPFCVTQIYTSVMRYCSKIWELIIVWSISSLLVLLMGYKLTNGFGIIGIGYSWFVVYSIFAVYAIIRIKKVLRKNE